MLYRFLESRFLGPDVMSTTHQTIDHATLRLLLAAGASVGAEVVGMGSSWGVVIHHGRARQTLAATRGQAKTFRHFETLAGYLKGLGIVEYRVNAAGFEPGGAKQDAPGLRSVTASERMKRAHEAAAYDTWLRQQVQASIDDPQASLSDEQAQAQMAASRQALLKKGGVKPMAKAAIRAAG